MAVVKPLLTPEDVERMIRCGELPEDGTWELVMGEVVPVIPNKGYYGAICARIIGRLTP